MYKSKIIISLIALTINIILAIIQFIFQNEALASILAFSFYILMICVLYWLYELVKYQLLLISFDQNKRIKKPRKLLAIIICVLLFIFTVLAYLVEHAKYVYLSDKLCEKESMCNCTLLNKKTNTEEDYNTHDFEKDKNYSIFIVEYKNIARSKKYIIYKTDAKYQLMKTYAFLFAFKEHDNKMAYNYLAVSYEALLYYKKEIKDIRTRYKDLVRDYNDSIKENKDTEAMMKIQEYLSKTKLNSISYNDIVRQMRISPTFTDIDEMKIWHNYFKNESDKELSRINNELNKLNDHFKNNILSKYQN